MSRLLSIPVAVAVTLIGVSNAVSASDPPVGFQLRPTIVEDFQSRVPVSLAAEPVPEPAGPLCASSAATACDSCRKFRKLACHSWKYSPREPSLCPGACFGYFQTQWHRWENVCPLPYQGIGVSDDPVRPSTPVVPKKGGSDGPIPKPLPIPPIPGK